jgi:DNA topoisomerase-6 subunit B
MPRATAETMAAKQRDISVSEFFAKNRHLLGFDNPRKALLTTVKEAVDNSLDACEEAGILPDITVVIEDLQPDRPASGQEQQVPRDDRGQRAGHRAQAGREHLRAAAVRFEVPPAQDVARPAGHRHLGGGHVRADHHGQADGDPHTPKAKKPAHHIELAMNTKTNRAEVTVDDETDDFPPRGSAG